MTKTTVIAGAVIGTVGVVAAVKYRKEIGAGCAKIGASVADMFSKKKPVVEAVVEAPVVEAVVEAPVVEAPVVEAVVEAPVVEAVVEAPVVEAVVEVAAALAVIVEAVETQVISPLTVEVVTIAVNNVLEVIQEAEKALEVEVTSPEAIQEATNNAMLELIGKVGAELASETHTVAIAEINPEVAEKLEQAMKSNSFDVPARQVTSLIDKPHHTKQWKKARR